MWCRAIASTACSSSPRSTPPRARHAPTTTPQLRQTPSHTLYTKLSASHSSTELRGRTHTHSTGTTHTNRPTHTGLSHSRAGNASPTHASGLAYKYRQGWCYVVMTAVFPGCFTLYLSFIEYGRLIATRGGGLARRSDAIAHRRCFWAMCSSGWW